MIQPISKKRCDNLLECMYYKTSEPQMPINCKIPTNFFFTIKKTQIMKNCVSVVRLTIR